jgi:hypothetical protein
VAAEPSGFNWKCHGNAAPPSVIRGVAAQMQRSILLAFYGLMY